MAAPSFPWVAHVCDGAGVLVTPQVALTAGHVVNNETTVDVTFPFAGIERRARVERCGDVDLAVLRLDSPVDLPPAPIRPSVKAVGHTVLVPGNLTRDDDVPRIARARATAPTAAGTMQIDVEPGAGYSIVPGHSGAPIIDEDLGAVIGLCVTREPKPDVKVGRFLVIERVAEMVPELRPWLGWRLTEQRADVGGRAPFAELHSHLCNARSTHWLPRAFGAQAGGGVARRPDLFHGRTAALGDLRDVLERRAAGVVIVTGEPGAGKSAVVSRLVVERDPMEGPAVDRGFSYAFFAKDRSAEHFARGVADALGGPHDAQIERAIDLVRTSDSSTLAIDGLDEAAPGQAGSIVSLAQRFADAGAAVVIGARRSVIPKRFVGRIVDLDSDEYFCRADLVAYGLAVLLREEQPGTPNRWRSSTHSAAEADTIASIAGKNFLVAGLLALSRSLDDPSEPAPPRTGTLAAAFDALLDKLDDQLGWEPR